ncbi:MAG TPA: type VI secretion system lipoprotein TssJ [Geobacter sp.]|nr:type VI secretion system lipoprotein TssJ [Geobacter sp.]
MVQPLIILLLASLLWGCSTRTRAVSPTLAGPELDSVRVLIKADPQLNRFESNPHALSLCLYLLKDPNGFKQLVQEKEGIPKLLDCSRFDATVVNARQIVVQPGQELKEINETGEGARYIGIATGYFYQGKRRVTELSLLSSQLGDGHSESRVRIELGPQEIRALRVE